MELQLCHPLWALIGKEKDIIKMKGAYRKMDIDISVEYEILENSVVIARNKYNRSQYGECNLSDVNYDTERAKEIAKEVLMNKIQSDKNDLESKQSRLSMDADNIFNLFK